MRMWPWGGRERTEVGKNTELSIPWLTFISLWGLGILAVLVCYLMTWLWSLQGWLPNSTFIEWWGEAFLPYFKTEWPTIIIWSLAMFFPSGLLFGVRLGMENLLKAWDPFNIESWFQKKKR